MSRAKELLQEQQDRHLSATQIAIDAGVLERCPYHDEVFDPLNGDPTPAYELGAEHLAAGKLKGLFSSEQQVRDAIDDAVSDAGMECGRSENLRSD